MLGWLIEETEKSVGNVVDMGCDILDGETPSRRQVKKLIADGVSVAAIATAADTTVEVIYNIAGE